MNVRHTSGLFPPRVITMQMLYKRSLFIGSPLTIISTFLEQKHFQHQWGRQNIQREGLMDCSSAANNIEETAEFQPNFLEEIRTKTNWEDCGVVRSNTHRDKDNIIEETADFQPVFVPKTLRQKEPRSNKKRLLKIGKHEHCGHLKTQSRDWAGINVFRKCMHVKDIHLTRLKEYIYVPEKEKHSCINVYMYT